MQTFITARMLSFYLACLACVVHGRLFQHPRQEQGFSSTRIDNRVKNQAVAFILPNCRCTLTRPLVSTLRHRIGCHVPVMSTPPEKVIHPDRFSVAPMMDYTDRYLRFLLRLLSRRSTLYTEMVATNTLFHNEDVYRWLRYNDPVEHPVVLQLGGNNVEVMRVAAAKAASYGYDDINLNCGCPSPKVAGQKSGEHTFGAALMTQPELVADLCLAISSEIGKPATVKCRIGVDDDDSYEQLRTFIEVVSTKAGVEHFIIHARKAILAGLSPKQNREIPPLKYHFVYDLVKEFPHLRFTLNGGVLTYEDIFKHLDEGAHGVMLGRAILDNPWKWSTVDTLVYGAESNPAQNRRQVLADYVEYAEEELAQMAIEDPKYYPRLRKWIARHLYRLFHGEKNGKLFASELDRLLLDPDIPLREVVERASSVIDPIILDAPPGEVFLPGKLRKVPRELLTCGADLPKSLYR